MTREELKPGYYKYKPKYMSTVLTIDIYYSENEKAWLCGYINDCGNLVTNDMLNEIEFDRPFKNE